MMVLRPEGVWTADGVHQGWCVTVDGGFIVGVGPPTRHTEVTDPLPGRILVPGFVNAHSHAFQRAFRGHVQWSASAADDFWTWRNAMYAVAQSLPPEGVEAVSRLAFLEMAEAGITHVGEFHYLHHASDGSRYADPDEIARRVIEAATDVGIRITLLRVAYARNAPGQPLTDAQLRFGDLTPDEVLGAVERLGAHPDPRVSVAIAPHSVRAVPAEWLAAFAGFDGVVHAHVAEQPREVAACHAEHDRSPLRVFADAGLVHDRFTAVHLTWPDPGDVAAIASAGAHVCACPTTEMDLGDGFLPLDAHALDLCVGSDSQATIDLLAEVRALEGHARAQSRRRIVHAKAGDRHGLATRLLDIATRGGARSLGAPVPAAPGIAVGAPADLVAIDLARPAAVGVPPLEAIAFCATPDWITDVWVAGRPVVREGRHVARDYIVSAALPWLHPT